MGHASGGLPSPEWAFFDYRHRARGDCNSMSMGITGLRRCRSQSVLQILRPTIQESSEGQCVEVNRGPLQKSIEDAGETHNDMKVL